MPYPLSHVALIVIIVVTLGIAVDGDRSISESGVADPDTVPKHGRCEPITIPLCDNLPYNETIMPNLLNHQKQEEAGLEVHQFFPLVEVKCSPDLKFFLCAMYAPVCTVIPEALPPCRGLCVSARRGCEGLMNKFGFQWPQTLDCLKFPESGLCVGPNSTAEGAPPPAARPPALDPGFPSGAPPPFRCPRNLSVHNLDYRLAVGGGAATPDCGAPCDDLFWSAAQRRFARVWVGAWSVACFALTVFAVATFALDPARFRYPERPIVFLSACYLFVALAYLAGYVLRDSIACSGPFRDTGRVTVAAHDLYGYGARAEAEAVVESLPVVTQGTKKEGCTILFMLLYFFTMASALWWVVLTVSWFLAAGLKWSSEAIEQRAHLFHLVAWATPAALTILVLALGKVDGDVLSGVCYVGVADAAAARVFVVAPLAASLLTGALFLAAGLASLYRIRGVVRGGGGGGEAAAKLERLMARIGAFAAMYAAPSAAVVACVFYEQLHLEAWMASWWARVASCSPHASPHYSDITCPAAGGGGGEREAPIFAVFLVKYAMSLSVGIASGIWIWSPKTLAAWWRCFYRGAICCRGGGGGGGGGREAELKQRRACRYEGARSPSAAAV
ncbi:PREDICTED: frizzled-2-like [Priapulus caudatus]|uniref:Frizzled-2-like n=1 Tax=Priapulus caudatus TaxID=37621 RepID=A0ABM1ES71_PRICU|nr:PREDICTED: frizzled-2-like [Priapulus caudatus]